MNETFYLAQSEYIALCDLLKACGAAQTGGHAKLLIAEGLVARGGVVETRKTAKIRAGEVITLDGVRIEVAAGTAA